MGFGLSFQSDISAQFGAITVSPCNILVLALKCPVWGFELVFLLDFPTGHFSASISFGSAQNNPFLVIKLDFEIAFLHHMYTTSSSIYVLEVVVF